MFTNGMKLPLDLMNGILLFLNSSVRLPGQEAVDLPLWLMLAVLVAISILVLGILRVSK